MTLEFFSKKFFVFCFLCCLCTYNLAHVCFQNNTRLVYVKLLTRSFRYINDAMYTYVETAKQIHMWHEYDSLFNVCYYDSNAGNGLFSDHRIGSKIGVKSTHCRAAQKKMHSGHKLVIFSCSKFDSINKKPCARHYVSFKY
jgi:hypothetical protein